MTWHNDGLTHDERVMLDIESKRWKFAGSKDAYIFDMLRMSATTYYQRLGELIDKPEALAHDPLTVKRLQRLRDARRHQRSQSRLRAIEGQ